jgi:hypothetical protein
MTSSEGAVVFGFFDDHCRCKHQCFVAEFVLDKPRDRYLICFRPTGVTKDSPNRYAWRYLNFGIDEIMEVAVEK